MNLRHLPLVWLWGLLLPLTSCIPAIEATNNDKPDVVTTSTILTDWTTTIAGDAVDVVGILKPGDDPHVYEPAPLDTKAFEDAELVLYNGYNLEPGLIRLMAATATRARKLAVGEAVPPLQLEEAGQTVPDPHVWGDVANAIVLVQVIRDALIELAPDDRATFVANADRFIAELKALDAWILQQTQTIPLPQRQLVTTHDAFQYYAQAYGLTIAGTLIGISTEEQPSAQTMQQLVSTIRATAVPAIFAETTINPGLIQAAADEAGVKLAPQELYADALGAPGSDGETYIKMMAANTKAIVENLGGRFEAFD